MYKYPTRGLAKRQANWPSLFPFICVRFRATAAPSVSSRLCFMFPRHLSDPIPPIATCHSCLQTHAFCSLVISSPSHLDRRPITHACSSGNNKPCTPLPVTLTRIPSSGTLHSFIFILHTSELSCGLTLRYTIGLPPTIQHLSTINQLFEISFQFGVKTASA